MSDQTNTESGAGEELARAVAEVVGAILATVPGWMILAAIGVGVLYGMGSARMERKGKKARPGLSGAVETAGEGVVAVLERAGGAVWRFVAGRPVWGAAKSTATFWKPGTAVDDPAPVAQLGSVAAAGPAPEPVDWRALGKRAAGAVADVRWLPGWTPAAVAGATRATGAVWGAVRATARGLGRWHQWRGAARSAARLAALAAVVGLVLAPGPTLVVLAVAVPALVTLTAVVGPYTPPDDQVYGPGLWAALVQVLQLSEEEQEAGAAHWMQLPADLGADGARIVIRLPLRWLGSDAQRQLLSDVLHSRVPGDWVGRYTQSGANPHVEFTPKPPPVVAEPLPEYVRWEPTDDPYRVHYGETHDGPAYILTKNSTPHIGVAGETGAGKSTIAYIALVAARMSGWLVTVIDPKQNSLVEAQGKSGVRYVTETYECVMAIAEYFTSMMAAEKYNARSYRGRHIGDRPIPRLLIIDELPSFRDFVAAWWKYIVKERGFPPVLVWFQIILMQGRSSDHRVFVGTHQYSLDVFGSTMARDQVGTKMVVGETSDPSWVVAYGQTTPRLNFDDSIKGRGVISTKGRKKKKIRPDGTPERVEEIQFAYLSPGEINEYLDKAPKAPEWFDRGDMAPWIGEEDIERADSAGAVREFLPGGEYVTREDLTPDADVPATATGTPRPRSEGREDVSLTPDGQGPASSASLAELAATVAQEEPVTPRYTLTQACQLGIIDRTPGAARQAKSDAIKKGKPFPEGEKQGRHTVYTVEELHSFYGVPDGWEKDDA